MFDHCLYFNTSALARQLEKMWAVAFEPFGLTPPQAFALRAVLASPGLLPHELADLLVVSRPTATRALDGLEKKGLVERRPSRRDGREFLVYPKPAALEISVALNAAAAQVTQGLKDTLGEEVFVDVVLKIRQIRSVAV